MEGIRPIPPIADPVLEQRLEGLNAAASRLQFRPGDDGREGIGVIGERFWVPYRISLEATLTDLAALLEHDRDEPALRAKEKEAEQSWVRGTLRDFEQRVRKSRRFD